ncbi:MAG: hypothetical protein WB439_15185, partial [Acidobacteriaceae bacterium]
PSLAVSFFACIVFASTGAVAHAQTQAPPTAFEKQLDKVDLSIQGAGIYNNTVTGTVVTDLGASNEGEGLTQHGSNTLGALVSIHYPIKPYFGLEFNYGYARYTENFTGPGITNFLPNGVTDFQVQTKVNEYTFGYLITPPYTIYGLQPFVSAGFGPQGFRPTPGGGQEEPEKARMTYYYSLGVQKDVSPHFGLRAGFRELFFLDPDFGQNYLTILKHATTLEPTAGFYLRY